MIVYSDFLRLVLPNKTAYDRTIHTYCSPSGW